MTKRLILLVVLSFGLLGQNRELNNKRSVLFVTPHSFGWGFEQNGSTHIQREVAMNNKILVISADDMRYDADAEEIELRGNVRVKLN
jgi:hypothetical protein